MKDRKLLNIELGRVSAGQYKDLPPSGIAVVLDNIRSAHNVGSAFRSSDAFKIDRIWLCGICATPPSAEIHKSALGAEDSVPWVHCQETSLVVRDLLGKGYELGAVEQTDDTHWRFSADVYDALEMLPWIRTFTGRITDLTCTDKRVTERFWKDLDEMLRMYGGETDVVS